jgi:uncharacterized protein YndB with AHSA1/START domain
MTGDAGGTAAVDRTVVDCEIRIAAPPETVFTFFTDPEKMIRWKGIAAELDPRPGGLYRVDINGRDVARGEYVVVEPPSRVVIAFGWEGDGDNPVPPGSTTLEVTLRPEAGGTLLRLSHSDLPVPVAPGHLEGWGHYLSRLMIIGSGGDPGPDVWMEKVQEEVAGGA